MKKGDKYVIEIEDVIESEVGTLYRIKGLNQSLFLQEKDFVSLEEISGLSKLKRDIFEEGRMTGWNQAVGYMSGTLEEMGANIENEECEDDEVEIEIRLNDNLIKSLFGDDDE